MSASALLDIGRFRRRARRFAIFPADAYVRLCRSMLGFQAGGVENRAQQIRRRQSCRWCQSRR
jgi:hypothetical protein